MVERGLKRGRDEIGQYPQGDFYGGFGYGGAPPPAMPPMFDAAAAAGAFPVADPPFAGAGAAEPFDRRVKRRSESKNTLRIRITKENASKIIGKAGSLIQSMTRQSGAHVNFLPADGESAMQVGQVSGSAEAIVGYIELMLFHLSRFATPEQKAQGDVLVLLVPASKIGSIIGKGGALVRNIQAQCGVKVLVSPRPEGGGDAEQDVTLSGSAESIAFAVRQMVHQLFPGAAGPAPMGMSPFAGIAPPPWAGGPFPFGGPPGGLAARSAVTGKELRFALKSQEVSRIIGKSGGGIRDLCKKSGASIVFDNTVQPSLGSIPGQAREALGAGQIGVLRGEPDAAIAALKAIIEKLGEPPEIIRESKGAPAEPLRPPGQVRLIIMVPSTQIGFLMGKKGANVLDIKEKTGSNINISPRAESVWDQAAGVALQALIIDGNVEQVSKATASLVGQLGEARKPRKREDGAKPE